MQHADGLSRLPLPGPPTEEDNVYEHPAVCRRLEAAPSLQELPGVRQWVATLREGGPVPQELKSHDHTSTPSKPGWHLHDSLVWVGSRVCLPREDARSVLGWIHRHPAVGGHMGPRRLLGTYRDGYLTTGDAQLAEGVVRSCLTCQAQKDYGRSPDAPSHPISARHAFEILSLDFVGPYPRTARQNTHILTIVDLFSRFITVVPTKNTTAQTVVKALMQHVFSPFNLPEAILTDQGPQFEAALVQETLQQLGVKKIRTTPYHPQTNGMNERVHRTLHNYLRCCVETEQQWDLFLPLAAMTYNNTRHAATGVTPHSLVFTWPRTPARLLHPTPAGQVSLQDHQKAYEKAREALLATQEAANDRAQAAHRRSRHYRPGDYVWIKNTPSTGENPKLRARWIGPYEVRAHDDKDVITISKKGEPYRVNVARTKPCHFGPPH